MIWLIGAGIMATEYAKVLLRDNVPFTVIGRGEEAARKMESNLGIKIVAGGISEFLKSKPALPKAAIVTAKVEALVPITMELIQYGVKRLLIEKPGALTAEELATIQAEAEQGQTQIYIAYNRRFYAATMAAREMIKEDGGVTSFNFEFTEWGHVIEKTPELPIVLDRWFLANSSHVADLAFHLGGAPKELVGFTAGALYWHSKAQVFAGAGVSESGALFSYQANWGAPGRWGVEVLTQKHRYYFRPMEKLSIQKIGSVQVSEVSVDYSNEDGLKPGLLLQTRAFLNNDSELLCTLAEQIGMFPWYNKIASYT